MTKSPAIAGRLLRLKPAAGYLSLSVWSLRGMVQRGEIPVIHRANAPWLVDVQDLDRWVEQNKERL